MVLTSCSVVSASIGLFSFLFFALVCSASVFCFLSLLFVLEYDYHDIYRLSIYSLYILIKIFVYTISPTFLSLLVKKVNSFIFQKSR